MKLRLLIALAMVAAALGVYSWYSQQAATPEETPVNEVVLDAAGERAAFLALDPAFRAGPFEGILPCADCSGLETTLMLVRESEGADMGTYTLLETYQGKDDRPRISKGTWTVLRGSAADPNATVYELLDVTPHQPRAQYYLRVSDRAVRMLSDSLIEIRSPFNHSLVVQ